MVYFSASAGKCSREKSDNVCHTDLAYNNGTWDIVNIRLNLYATSVWDQPIIVSVLVLLSCLLSVIYRRMKNETISQPRTTHVGRTHAPAHAYARAHTCRRAHSRNTSVRATSISPGCTSDRGITSVCDRSFIAVMIISLHSRLRGI